jgi:predicted NBD/HSP70 family sugar kinase
MVPHGEPCPCGNHGCLERYLSLEALNRRSPEIGIEAWIAEAAPYLRSAIVTIENLFDPETIIIGGLADQSLLSDLLHKAEPLASSISNHKNRKTARVTLSASGHNAVLRGAAALAVSGVLSPRFGQMFTGDDGHEERDPMMKSVEAA